MFFADEPYVSEFFKTTVKDNAIPVVDTDIARNMLLHRGTNLLSEDEAIEIARSAKNPAIYTTSENSIAWIANI